MRKRGELGAQHLMRAQRRHLPFEGVGAVEPPCLHMADDIVMDVLEVAELLVEMARQQKRGIAQFALGNLERAFAELQRQIGRAKRDRHHQRGAAQDQPLDRAHPGADQRGRFRQQPARRDGAAR